MDTKPKNLEGDDLDRALDAALAKYAGAEPRPGLEERILAHLESERRHLPSRSWWQWSAACAGTALLVVTIALAWRARRPAHQITGRQTPTVNRERAQLGMQVVADGEQNGIRSQHTRRPPNTTIRRGRRTLIVADAPKLDVFPSPQPLSEQEKILVSYVASFHAQAALIARVTNQELQRDRMELMKETQGSAESGNQETTNR